MRTRIAWRLLVALVVAVVVIPRGAAAATPMRLIVTPAEGHAGDPVYLSGSGFGAGLPVSIFLKCGSQPKTHVSTARANKLGRFAASQIRLSRGTPAGRCEFSAASQARPAMRTRESAYALVPLQRALARCAVQMCLHIQAFLVRLRNGAKGNVVISGWPGATVHVTIARTEHGAKYRVLRLNWRGVGGLRTSIAPGLIKGLQARVFVSAQLGRVTGQAVSRFHVMFGNR
jgi:hypothetical protein